MAPELPARVIGIRPGEKLHEIMQGYLQTQGYTLVEKISEHDYVFAGAGVPA